MTSKEINYTMIRYYYSIFSNKHKYKYNVEKYKYHIFYTNNYIIGKINVIYHTPQSIKCFVARHMKKIFKNK